MAVKRKETQSYRLYKVLKKHRNGATREQLASATGVKEAYLGSYLNEMKRVYDAKISYHPDRERYTLDNNIQVPPHGVAGRKPGRTTVRRTAGSRAARSERAAQTTQ